MIEVNSVLFMGLWELVLLLLAVNVVILVRFIIRSRREKASIERLVTIVRQDEERRKKETRDLLEKKYGYSGEQLEKATKKIIREEKRIYQILANLFTTRDNVAIENLSIIFEEVVEPYRALDVPRAVKSNDAAVEGEDNGTDLQQLKDLNQTLNEELRVTMNTLSRMLHEYSVLLADSNVAKDDSGAIAELIKGEPVSARDASPVTAGEMVEERVPDVTTEAASHAEVELQEEDEAEVDVLETVVEAEEKEEPAEAVETEAAVEAVEPEDADKNIDSASLVGMFQEDDDEDVLAQEIGEVLENTDAGLSDIELDKIDSELSGAATDPAEALLAQAIGETLESHETPLPDFTDVLLEDEDDATADEADVEKKLTDEIAETLNGHSKNMSDEDIDSLLQGAIEDISEK